MRRKTCLSDTLGEDSEERELLEEKGSSPRMPLFENPDKDGRTVVGVALVFPASQSDATLEYVEGSVNAARAAETT